MKLGKIILARAAILIAGTRSTPNGTPTLSEGVKLKEHLFMDHLFLLIITNHGGIITEVRGH